MPFPAGSGAAALPARTAAVRSAAPGRAGCPAAAAAAGHPPAAHSCPPCKSRPVSRPLRSAPSPRLPPRLLAGKRSARSCAPAGTAYGSRFQCSGLHKWKTAPCVWHQRYLPLSSVRWCRWKQDPLDRPAGRNIFLRYAPPAADCGGSAFPGRRHPRRAGR